VIYPTLAMLADEGLVAEQDSEDQRRKFAITEAGQAVLEEEADTVAEAYERLSQMGERAQRGREPSIERASVNLFTAVGQRMRTRGDEEREDLGHRIAEILDEAAQKIERL
jgi:DNA-binding PadR family transcriptional regulator